MCHCGNGGIVLHGLVVLGYLLYGTVYQRLHLGPYAVKIVWLCDSAACDDGLRDDAGLTGGTATVNWPWRRFLNAVVEELTGPLPLTFGILGIAACCFMAMSGNRGQFSMQLIGLVFAISIVLFAPNFVNIISSSGAALTIMP